MWFSFAVAVSKSQLPLATISIPINGLSKEFDLYVILVPRKRLSIAKLTCEGRINLVFQRSFLLKAFFHSQCIHLETERHLDQLYCKSHPSQISITPTGWEL